MHTLFILYSYTQYSHLTFSGPFHKGTWSCERSSIHFTSKYVYAFGVSFFTKLYQLYYFNESVISPFHLASKLSVFVFNVIFHMIIIVTCIFSTYLQVCYIHCNALKRTIKSIHRTEWRTCIRIALRRSHNAKCNKYIYLAIYKRTLTLAKMSYSIIVCVYTGDTIVGMAFDTWRLGANINPRYRQTASPIKHSIFYLYDHSDYSDHYQYTEIDLILIVDALSYLILIKFTISSFRKITSWFWVWLCYNENHAILTLKLWSSGGACVT